jgi:hypothetical protein
MKLIELLARELKEWPIDFRHAQLTQSVNGKIEYIVNNKSKWSHCDPLPLADDWRVSIINYDDWSHAVVTPGSTTTPTLETMLAEWRDLEARAQAAQAEADALFEHAGQCHGEIVVRLAELGWGAPRGPMVPGEPVVTLDDNDGWIDWNGGDQPVPDGTIIDTKYRDGDEMFHGETGQFGTKTSVSFWIHENHENDIVAYRLTPSAQP